MNTYRKFPYRVEFPDSSESARNSQTLEDSLWWARWTINRVWKESSEWGVEGEPTTDAETAVITNRNTGYRWILRRKNPQVEFQTSEMFEEAVANESLDVHLTVEEAEALAHAAKSGQIKDPRLKALTDQALDQIGLLCRQVRERVRLGDSFIDAWTRGIPRLRLNDLKPAEDPPAAETPELPKPKYRPLGDPDNLSLKEAGEILGKARNTVYLWYRQGKFPPAVDVGPFLKSTKPVIVVPQYRLEAWQSGERMPEIFQEVFDSHGLHEPPWVCWSVKKGVSAKDVSFWLERRNLKTGISKEGKRIFGMDLTADKPYELFS